MDALYEKFHALVTEGPAAAGDPEALGPTGRLITATGGVIANSLNAETGKVAAVRVVGREDEELMLITEEGTILRTEVSSVNRYRRASRGVTVMKPGRPNCSMRMSGASLFAASISPVGRALRNWATNERSPRPAARILS